MGVVFGELLPTGLRNEPGDFRLNAGELVGVVFGELPPTDLRNEPGDFRLNAGELVGVVFGELLPTGLRNEPGDFRLSAGELVGVVFGEEGLPRVTTDFFTLAGTLVGVALALVGVAVGVGDAFFTSMDVVDITFFFPFLDTADVCWVGLGLWKVLRPLGLKIGVLLGLGLRLLREILEGDFENGREPSSESDVLDVSCGVREINKGLLLPPIDDLRTGLRELAKRANFFLSFKFSSSSRLSVDSFLMCLERVDPELSVDTSILLLLSDVVPLTAPSLWFTVVPLSVVVVSVCVTSVSVCIVVVLICVTVSPYVTMASVTMASV